MTVYSKRRHGRPCLSVGLRTSEADEAGAIDVSVADIVVMDGVVHEIDTLLLPASHGPNQGAKGGLGMDVMGWLDAVLRRVRIASESGSEKAVAVDDIVERLGPFLPSSEEEEGR